MLALALAACLLASAAHAWNPELCNNNTCYYYQNNTDTEHQIDGALLRHPHHVARGIVTNTFDFDARGTARPGPTTAMATTRDGCCCSRPSTAPLPTMSR